MPLASFLENILKMKSILRIKLSMKLITALARLINITQHVIYISFIFLVNQKASEAGVTPVFGVYHLIKCSAVHHLDLNYNLTQKLDWRDICTEYGLDEEIKDFISLSVFSLFNNPDLFAIRV